MAPNTGLTPDHRLQPPPPTPNCMHSMVDPKKWWHYIQPIAYTDVDRDQARELLKAAVLSLPRTRLVQEQSDYLCFEALTPSEKFTDDVEFLLPENEAIIHMRSASRVGFNDWNVNRKRLEAVRKAFNERLAQART